jgi:hypothetical protein
MRRRLTAEMILALSVLVAGFAMLCYDEFTNISWMNVSRANYLIIIGVVFTAISYFAAVVVVLKWWMNKKVNK